MRFTPAITVATAPFASMAAGQGGAACDLFAGSSPDALSLHGSLGVHLGI